MSDNKISMDDESGEEGGESEEVKVKKKRKTRKVIRKVIVKKKKAKKVDEEGDDDEPKTPTKKKTRIVRKVIKKKKTPKTPASSLKDTDSLFPDTPTSKTPGKKVFSGDSDSEEEEKKPKKKKLVFRLSAKKKKELEELQKASEEEIRTRVDGMVGEMRQRQKPRMTKTLKKMNEYMVNFMKDVIGDVTDDVKDFQIMKKMAELSAREHKIKEKELELMKREHKLKKKEEKFKVKEEELGKNKKKPDSNMLEMGTCAREYMDIEDQFDGVDKGHFSIARESENLPLNRYSNILPYNHTLVKLQSKRYINANHIDMYGLRFIGTQWPLDASGINTEEEFWEMNYDHDVHVVVALQKPAPPKHQLYLPKEKGDTLQYGKMAVYHKSKIVHPFFHVVTCLVKKGGGKIKETMKGLKEVKVCLFLTWPDHDIPKKQHPLFAMIKTARLMNIDMTRSAHERVEFPIVVHCSAGVGRTGVYIVCDVCIQKGYGIDKVKEVLIEMRKQRYGMIQNAKQYKYVYDLVNQYATED